MWLGHKGAAAWPNTAHVQGTGTPETGEPVAYFVMDNPPSLRFPDLSARPHDLVAEKTYPFPPRTLYWAWTEGFDRWFAAPGSVWMQPVVGAPYFFETEHQLEANKPAERHPHYGRFLKLEPDRLVQLTWVTGAKGTLGAETVVTVELEAQGEGTHLRLRHAGFADEKSRDQHATAWPHVLAQMERRLDGVRPGS